MERVGCDLTSSVMERWRRDGEGRDGVRPGRRDMRCVIVVVLPVVGVPQIKTLGRLRILGARGCVMERWRGLRGEDQKFKRRIGESWGR